MSRVELSGSINNNMLYTSYTLESKDMGLDPCCTMREFTETIQFLFPRVTRRKVKCKDRSVSTIYDGITVKPLDKLGYKPEPSLDLQALMKLLPDDCKTEKLNNQSMCCKLETNYLSNGNNIVKNIQLDCDNTFSVTIANTNVKLQSIGISNTFPSTKYGVSNVFKCVDRIRLCVGVKVTTNVVCTRFHVIEQLNDKSTNISSRQLRSIMCSRVVKFNATSQTCITCQRMTRQLKTAESNKENATRTGKQDQGQKPLVTKTLIKQLVPNAPDNLVELLLSQFQNVGVHPNGRRWSKEIMNSCLQIYTRSPAVYRQIRDSKLLVLPSPSFLLTYKNKVKHNVGFHDEIFRWMHAEARRLQLPEQAMTGGIVIDEMAIQQNLEVAKNGDIIELVGLEDVGEEGNMCATLRKGHQEKSLGTHAVQFMFLGISGFRFPFAHFVSTNIQAYDLHRLFWEAVSWLKMYGFIARYVSLDGAQTNRTFMGMNLGKSPSSMICENPSPYDPSIVIIMDSSHVMKKIRNNILKSGVTKGSTRLLTLPDGSTIQWEMWRNAFQWDRSNALQIHNKLTNEHLFPSSQSKMRNKLAEDVLSSEMLNLMSNYRATLSNSTALDGAIEILQRTSKMIDIFQDKSPVRSVDDNRLKDLLEICEWFDKWSAGVQREKDKNSMLLSSQCREDVRSCLIGFCELCKIVLIRKDTMIIPAMINSDIVENHFCQHRATYNGANTNPTALQYRRNLNSIILGQNIVSQKCNAGNMTIKSPKLSFTSNARVKRPLADSASRNEYTRLKVIRM